MQTTHWSRVSSDADSGLLCEHMDQLSLKESCLCHFCETAVTSKSLFPVELSDRLYDLSALQALTDELKSETIELVEVIAAESNFTQIFSAPSV